MKVYFGILKANVKFSDVKKKIQRKGIKIDKYYSKLRILKFAICETEDFEDILNLFFESYEEEKEDFSV